MTSKSCLTRPPNLSLMALAKENNPDNTVQPNAIRTEKKTNISFSDHFLFYNLRIVIRESDFTYAHNLATEFLRAF